MINKRAKAISQRRNIDISREAVKVIELSTEQLVKEIKPIAKGLANIKAIDNSVLVYI